MTPTPVPTNPFPLRKPAAAARLDQLEEWAAMFAIQLGETRRMIPQKPELKKLVEEIFAAEYAELAKVRTDCVKLLRFMVEVGITTQDAVNAAVTDA